MALPSLRSFVRRTVAMPLFSARAFATHQAPLWRRPNAFPATHFRQFSDCSKSKAPAMQKTWDADSCLEDHAEVFTSLPSILGAYIGPNSVPAKLNESIMVTVNSANECPYCEGLHGELARMAGVDSKKLQAATSVAECTAVVDDVAVSYARVFAENGGRGADVDAAFAQVAAEHGEATAGSVQALCWFLTWGAKGGNTLNSILFEGRRGGFELLYAIYYGPLFGVIAVINKGLAMMPPMPGVFFQGFGTVLTVVAGSYLAPVGILGVARRATKRP